MLDDQICNFVQDFKSELNGPATKAQLDSSRRCQTNYKSERPHCYDTGYVDQKRQHIVFCHGTELSLTMYSIDGTASL